MSRLLTAAVLLGCIAPAWGQGSTITLNPRTNLLATVNGKGEVEMFNEKEVKKLYEIKLKDGSRTTGSCGRWIRSSRSTP